MKTFACLLLVLVSLGGAGCARSRFAAYVGEQSRWPTVPGAFCRPVAGVSVYRGYPERAYEVIGTVELRRGALADIELAAARECRRHGGDAVIIVASVRGRRSARVSRTYLDFLEGRAEFPRDLGAPFPLQPQSAFAYVVRFRPARP